MWAIDSPRHRRWIGAGWLAFAGVNAALMYVFPGQATIPYHLIWASFAYLYGIVSWPGSITWPVFFGIVVVTGAALVMSAARGFIGWEECFEIVLMAVTAGLLVWHVDRHRAARARMTALREEERGRAAQRELATRFGSHEIKTRLTIARGLIELVGDDSDDPQVSRDCRLASAELDKATALTNDLMTFVRAEDASLPLEDVDVDEMIEATAARWQARSDRVWTLVTDVGTQACDPERFEAAIDCLIENAVKFTEPGDHISVRALRDGADLVVAVSDTGAGIPADDLGEVTQLFRTSRTAGERAGNGLGLAIVRAMAEARGGSVHIASTLGTGTTVTVRVPVGAASRGTPRRTTEAVLGRRAPAEPGRGDARSGPSQLAEPVRG